MGPQNSALVTLPRFAKSDRERCPLSHETLLIPVVGSKKFHEVVGSSSRKLTLVGNPVGVAVGLAVGDPVGAGVGLR